MSGKNNNEKTNTTGTFFAYDAKQNSVREATGKGTEWDAMKVVIRASLGTNWFEGVPKGRANRVALFTAIQAEVASPLIGQFSSLKVASQKKNLGVHVTKETKNDAPKATKVDEQPTIADLMAMIASLQAQQD